jgi:hypothetical protein
VPGAAMDPARVMVLSGLDKVPGFESLPHVATYKVPASAPLVIAKVPAPAAAAKVDADRARLRRWPFMISLQFAPPARAQNPVLNGAVNNVG